ncbi:DUF4238 domain-containing protein [Streptomyces sp. SL13]|uniref:DUF4238 domain-containing protein n=1 Tax=Streptantibioticus silvisoli TaxID=2705255 RepID=A0AA90K9R4_9ACTN|nr:DUF4238 domain-containing protein [Streptantibioticus silvisoli]MDI5971533.1 DUF4238 domain-containing protein [Streptantibioticus silvisoli]
MGDGKGGGMGWKVVKRVPNPWGQVPISGGGRSVVATVAGYMARVREEANRRDCVSRRHHYVPQSYLRAWSPDGRRVRVLDTRNGTERLQVVRDTCVKENFYRFTGGTEAHNQAEAMLAVIDDETARLLRTLYPWSPGDDFNFDDFMSLAVVLALQRNRTPQIRRYLAAIDTWQRERAAQTIRPLTAEGHVTALFESAFRAADEHSTRQLEIWDDPRHRFITSDQPVQLSDDAGQDYASLATSSHLWWPISPGRLVVLSTELKEVKVIRRVVDRATVDRVRRATVKGAESVIIAKPNDSDLPVGKRLNRRPQLRVDCSAVAPDERKCRVRFTWGYGTGTVDRACDPLCAMTGTNSGTGPAAR